MLSGNSSVLTWIKLNLLGYRDAALAVGGMAALAGGLAYASIVYTSSEEVQEEEANDEAEEGFLDYASQSRQSYSKTRI